MFDANVNYYHELVKYILAGEQGCKELEAYIAQRQSDFEATGDNSIQLELASLNNSLMMLEQRTQDLRTAENIAIQSIPMIKTMEFSNMNLVRKINLLLPCRCLSRRLPRRLCSRDRRFRRNQWRNWIRRRTRC